MATPRHLRRNGARLVTLVGAVVILLIGGVVYVSYTALEGLPWQRTYDVAVEVRGANRLIETNDVRIGGIRVGQVSKVTPIRGRGGEPFARIELALDPSVGPLPADTVVRIRPASVLGATFVDLGLGQSRRTISEGGTLPLEAAIRTVELTDLFDVFDRSTARNLRSTMGDLAGGLAGRGTAINSAIGSSNSLLPPLTDVARTLASPETRLAEFLRAYESAFVELGPVSAELGGLVSAGASTFEALAGEREALGAMIEAAAPAQVAATRAFEDARPGLDGLARLIEGLEPAGRLLPQALDEANSALTAGVTPLRQLPRFSGRLKEALQALETLSRDPATDGALRKLTELLEPTNAVLELLVPAQVHCNAVALWSELGKLGASMGVGHGPGLPIAAIKTAGGSGEVLQNARPSPDVGMNPFPNLDERECESGNEPWTGEQQIGNPPGLQSSTTRETAPPPGVRELARKAGLLDDPEGAP